MRGYEIWMRTFSFLRGGGRQIGGGLREVGQLDSMGKLASKGAAEIVQLTAPARPWHATLPTPGIQDWPSNF